MKKISLKHFALGAIIGAGVGVLFAPKNGKDTRKALASKMNDLVNKAKEIDKEDVKVAIENKVNDLKLALENLDKETVLEEAKKQGKKIKDMTQELVNYVVSKGTPVLEDAAEKVRMKAIDVTKDVLAKLEKTTK